MKIEVFRISTFNPNLNYAFALKTSTEGRWPNEKHYTTNELQYLGKHVESKRWGYHDNSSGSETFDNNGIKIEIVYDYDGKTCFTVYENSFA